MKNESQQLLDNLSFVAIDLETTGGNHQTDKIIEIGLVKIENREITQELHYLINPEIKIPQFIQKLTSISQDDIQDAPTIENVIDEILEFIGDKIVVAHNVSFDFPFLNSVLERMNRPKLENRNICTNLMTKYMIPNILSSNLNYMSQIFDIQHDVAHRALEDAQACAHLLLKYLEVFISKNIRKVNQLYYPRSKFELDRSHYGTKENDKFLSDIERITSPAIISFKGESGLQLATLPLQDPSLEKDIIREFLGNIKYKGLSIQLMGTFFEGFMVMNTHFNKFDDAVKERIAQYLFKKHLNSEVIPLNNEKFIKGVDENNFLFLKHLVPGQMIVYPLFNLQNKNELIFRFPAHKKRIQQYITAQSRRKKSGKKTPNKHPIHRDLFSFITMFLELKKKDKSKQYLFLTKDIAKDDKGKFFNYLHHFSSYKDPNNQYPKEHI